MSQPRPHGASSPAGSVHQPFSARITGISIPMTSTNSQPDQDDPLTGPLLKHWAADQKKRLEETQPVLDLWAGIEKKLKG